MKILLSILVSLFLNSAFASGEWDGGQTGNGSNGCWVSGPQNKYKWKTVEELVYWNDISHNVFRYETVLRAEKPLKLAIKAPRHFYSVNLLDTITGKRALQRLERLSAKFPQTYKSIMNLSHLMEDVTVVQFEADGIFEGEITKHLYKCKYFSPAMITKLNGDVFVFRPVWNELSNLTAEIVLVHELIRFAQTFHPGFYDLTNEELQKLTALLFSNSNETFFLGKILDRIEPRLEMYY